MVLEQNTAVAFSPDGTSSSPTGDDRGGLAIWDADDVVEAASARKGSDAGYRGLAFSPDGRTLAAR